MNFRRSSFSEVDGRIYLILTILYSIMIDINVEILIRLLISVVLGGLIGFEREKKVKPAGLRTNMLVCLGSCLFTIVSVTGFSVDPARVAAGIVTGIGFLGAGSIIATGGQIVGITTAATLWVVSGIGLVVGIGDYVVAIVSTILVYLILIVKKPGTDNPESTE
jgi:putative Mg2+ transporter-C (MgtC) family protein